MDSNGNLKKISLILIATNRYKQFVRPLLESAAEFFFPGTDIEICLFTDKPEYFENYEDETLENISNYRYLYNISGRFNIKLITIPPHGFPAATLYRYAIFIEHIKEITGDYVFYSDVDMKFVGNVEADILQGNLIATLHPGFYATNGGSWCDNKASTAYTQECNRNGYYAGGFQGGIRAAYLSAAMLMAERINEDDKNGIKAEHNDEHHWNRLISETQNVFVLNPTYCMVEEPHLREEWKIDFLQPKILALSKNHDEIREIPRE